MADFGRLRRSLLGSSRADARISREVVEELELHIVMRAEALEHEGMTPADARAQARLEFGDLDDATRYCTRVDRSAARRRRRSSLLSEARQDAGHALRILRRAPAFTAATVLTLALAAGASTAVYGVLHAYLVRPLPFPESDRLAWVNAPMPGGFARAPSMEGVDWTGITSLFEAAAVWDLDGFTIPGDQHAESVVGAWVSPGYFQALGVRPAMGRGFTADEYREGAPVVMLSHDLWVRRFAADPDVVGSTITAHSTDRPDEVPLVTIVGVLPRGFWPIQWRESDLLRPLRPANAMPYLVKLASGASLVETQERLDGMVRAQIRGEIDPAWQMKLVPALEVHSARARPLLLAALGAVLFMFLAACASVAGALVGRTAARRSELALRVALGGGRARIVRQLLTESAVLATLAGALGVMIAYVLLDAAGPIIERQLGTTAPGGAGALRPGMSIMLGSLVLSTLAGIAVGLVPALGALRLDRVSPAPAILAAGRSSSARAGGAHLRRVLVAGQVSVAMVLLFGAGLMFRTIARIAGADLGFRADGVMTATVLLPQAQYPDSTARRQVMDRLLARTSEVEGVRSAAAVFPLPFWWSNGPAVFAEGAGVDEESAPRAIVFTVSSDYFETMDVALRAGRTFRAADDYAAPLVVVISEGLARRIAPDGDAIGRRIRTRVPHLASFNDQDDLPWRTVVGVVADTKEHFAAGVVADVPDVYVPYAQNPRARQSIVVRTDRAVATIFDPVRRAAASVDPALALAGVQSMTDLVAEGTAQRRGLTALLGVFAAFALGLSALALYASLSYIVVQRRSELAVRMAVGASARSILRLVVAEGLATASIGAAGGLVASLALGRVLENQVYGVGTSDPATLVAISLVLTLAAVAACVVPGLRAARTDPALAFRD